MQNSKPKPKLNEQNAHRELISIVSEICELNRISLTSFSDDWILLLQRDGVKSYVFGYDFGLNNATAKMICKDKAATSALLQFWGVPCVAHEIFHGPQLVSYTPQEGNWAKILSYFHSHNDKVVCKPNEGTGGGGVTLARTVGELENAVYNVFKNHRSLSISPYEEITQECRVALLNGGIHFVYAKDRPGVTGDGIRSIRDLTLDDIRRAPVSPAGFKEFRSLAEANLEWDRVPAKDEVVNLNWRHNLGQGAIPKFIDEGSDTWVKATTAALNAAAVLDIAVASVDVVEISGEWKILEINSGIMMENLVRNHEDGRRIATEFYKKIISSTLRMDIQ